MEVSPGNDLLFPGQLYPCPALASSLWQLLALPLLEGQQWVVSSSSDQARISGKQLSMDMCLKGKKGFWTYDG